jgi:hypothetical protein
MWIRCDTHLPPETVDTVTFSALDGSIIEGYVSTIAFHAQAALIAAGTPPPEKAIPTDISWILIMSWMLVDKKIMCHFFDV